MKVLGWILRKNRGWVWLTFLVAVFSNISQIIYMYYVGDLMNKIEERSKMELSFLLIMGVFLLLNAFSQYICQLTSRYTAERTAHTLRMGFMRAKVYRSSEESKGVNRSGSGDEVKSTNGSGSGDEVKSINGSGLGEAEEISAASAMSIVQNELTNANNYLSNTFFDMIGMSISGILVLICLLFINFKLTMVILIPTLFILVYVLWSGGKLSKAVERSLNEKSHMNKIAYSSIENDGMIRVFGAKEFLLKKYDAALNKWGVTETKKDRLYAICNSLSGVLSHLPLLLLLLVGCYMVVTGQMLLGTLFVFLNLQNNVTGFIMNMPMWIARFKGFTVNLSRIDVL